MRVVELQGADRVEFRMDGVPIQAIPGTSIASALMEAGIAGSRIARGGDRRGYYCGMGVCWECVVSVAGRGNVRSCLEPVAAGLDVSSLPAPGAAHE